MNESFSNDTMDASVREWLAVREKEALKIDPETAEVFWKWTETADPYGVYQLPEEYRQIGRVFFARAPGSEVWVAAYDLPEEALKRLRELHNF